MGVGVNMKTTLATFSLGVASVALLASCADLSTKFNFSQPRITSSTAVDAGAVALSGASNAPKTA
jgi:hypothetical protein